LHVIEILNNYGVGTFWNIAAGFHKVSELMAENPGHQAIINSSLTLAFPTKGQDGYTPTAEDEGLCEVIQVALGDFGEKDPDKLAKAIKAEPGKLRAMQATVGDLVAATAELFADVIETFGAGAFIVSASGNDSDRLDKDIRRARYLAETELST